MKKLLLQLLGQKVYAKAERWKKKIFPTQFDIEQRRAYDAQLNFYSQFIKPGNLCFDIGANLGLKTKLFLQLGAKVITVEPQAKCIDILKKELTGKATIIAKGVGAVNEFKDFYISHNIELSSFNGNWANNLPKEEFVDTGINNVEVIEIITLDDLIKQFGIPDFIKIDVEGYEKEVFKGLNQPFRSLSFEFFVTNGTKDLLECLDILNSKFTNLSVNFAKGNKVNNFELDKWLSINAFKEYINKTDFTIFFAGDIYIQMNDHISAPQKVL